MAGLLDQPPPPPKRVHGNTKTLILWVVLICMFVAIYQLFQTPSPAPRRTQSATDWMPGLFGLGGVVVACVFFFFRRRALDAFNAANNEAIDWLNKGMAARAAERFAELAQKHRWPRSLATTARFNTGHAQLRAGKHLQAIEELTALIKVKDVERLKGTIAIELTVAHALVGQLPDAAAWLERAEQTPGVSRYNLVWPRALLAARRGELKDTARALESSWRELEVHLSGEMLRRLTLLRAFAMATAEGPRGESTAEPLLARLRPVSSEEFDWLTVQWPELGAFVASHQLH